MVRDELFDVERGRSKTRGKGVGDIYRPGVALFTLRLARKRDSQSFTSLHFTFSDSRKALKLSLCSSNAFYHLTHARVGACGLL